MRGGGAYSRADITNFQGAYLTLAVKTVKVNNHNLSTPHDEFSISNVQ